MDYVIDSTDRRIAGGLNFSTPAIAHDHVINNAIPGSMYFEEYAGALLGLHEGRPVYSEPGIVDILMTRDGMTQEDAIEWVNFNIYGLLCQADSCFVIDPEHPDPFGDST